MDRTRVSATIDPAPPGAPACRNCGVALTGPYCARCGQEDVPLDRSLRQILRDGLEDFAALDSRLVRTLVTLLFRPGRLTVDYNEGRRIRYVPPLRLYMVASVIFFFVLALMPNFGEYDIDVPDDGEESTVGIEFEPGGDAAATDGRTDSPRPDAADTAGAGADAPGLGVGAADDGEGSPEDEASSSPDSGFEAWIETQARDVTSDPRGFAIFWIRVLAWSMFVLLPVAALLLMLVYRRPKRYYVQHLVFTLHTHAFAFIVLTAALGIGMLLLPESGVAAGGDDDPVNTPFLVAMGLIAIYLYIALVRTYGDGWIRTAVKFCAVGFAYFVAQMMVMMASAFVALGLF